MGKAVARGFTVLALPSAFYGLGTMRSRGATPSAKEDRFGQGITSGATETEHEVGGGPN
jgi:hypothetical protein